MLKSTLESMIGLPGCNEHVHSCTWKAIVDKGISEQELGKVFGRLEETKEYMRKGMIGRMNKDKNYLKN